MQAIAQLQHVLTTQSGSYTMHDQIPAELDLVKMYT